MDIALLFLFLQHGIKDKIQLQSLAEKGGDRWLPFFPDQGHCMARDWLFHYEISIPASFFFLTFHPAFPASVPVDDTEYYLVSFFS